MISVVIPAWNEEKYLNECLDSLRHQDFDDVYEIIVVDNSSTDSTVKIAQDYGARIVKCLEKGVINARKAGAESALGDIIAQADADTTYPPNWLVKIQKHFLTKPKVNAVAGLSAYREPPSWAFLEYFLRRSTNRLLGIPFLHRPIFVSGANFAFRREAFIEVDGYNGRVFYPDQWGICTALSRTGKIAYDTSIIALTSSRRVQKPFPRIALETLINIRGVLKHLSAYLLKKYFQIGKHT